MNSTQALTDNPATLTEAKKRPDAELWVQAVNEEMSTLAEKQVYAKADPPLGVEPIPSRLVLTIKRDSTGNIEKYKARLVAKGFKQRAGVDYDEIFAPTADRVTLRMLLALAAANDMVVDQIDVRTAFLNGDLEEDVYIKLPNELGGGVRKLHKALYGLKQAARAWHDK